MTVEKWLVTGGAGFIGAHVTDLFLNNGKQVVLVDSLLKGMESRVEYLRKKHNTDVPLEVFDIREKRMLEEVIVRNEFKGIVHLAALKSVNESVDNPTEYMDVNYSATNELLKLAQKHGIKKFIFSSTAAVYGEPDSMQPCKENDPLNPISPYGSTKLDAERKVTQFVTTPGNSGTSFRFFNVVGTSSKELVDNSVENLVPIVLGKLSNKEAPEIFGNDYPTKDGTCVRDFVDVRDIAAAHLVAANTSRQIPTVINLGTGTATSVRQVIDIVLKIKGISISELCQ